LFRLQVITDTKREPVGEFYLKYGQWTRTATDRVDTITRRHEFFLQQMYEWTKPAMKDPNRIFGELEREIIYARDKKRCQVCDAEVLWADSEIHHVEMHSLGGKTSLENGALVHKKCHPKSATEVAAFASKWIAKLSAATISAVGIADPATAGSGSPQGAPPSTS
ncbi:MAG: HNH endonuclease signature motif containing protein, partial [Tepidisphaeraceae bacterium]